MCPQAGCYPRVIPGAHHHETVDQGGTLSFIRALIHKPQIDVREYGAVEGGVVDCTTEIQDAIDAAQALAYHPVVFIPAGRWLIEGTLNIIGDQNTLKGAGIRSTWLHHNPGAPNTRCLVVEKGFPASPDDFNEIKDFMIWGNHSNSSYLLSVIHQASFIAENIYLHGNGLSVPFIGHDLVHANFKTVHFKRSSSDGAIIDVGTGVNTTTIFDNCYFTSNLRHGARFDKAITMNIKNSIIESNEDVGLNIGNTEYVELTLDKNHFENNTNGVIVAGAHMARKTIIHSIQNRYGGKLGTVDLIDLDNVDFYSKDISFVNYVNRIVKTANTSFHEETEFSQLNLGVPTELTIAGGVITITKNYHNVDGQGDAADDLVTINGGLDGMPLTLALENNARVITVKHGLGNIILDGGADFVIATVTSRIKLQYDLLHTSWVELSRAT